MLNNIKAGAEIMAGDGGYSEFPISELRPSPYKELMAGTVFAEDLEMFFAHFDFARKQSMEFEFMKSMLEDYKSGSTLPEAIMHANREWDL